MYRIMSRCFSAFLSITILFGIVSLVCAAGPIKIGDINSYSKMPAFTGPYRNGWQLAMDEINESGGLIGKPIEIVSRDDAGSPADAIRVASELVSKEKVDMLMGTFFSHVGLAVSDFSKQKKIVFLAPEALTDAMTWQKGNRYTFRLRSSTYMQAAMLVKEASKFPGKRWATIAPNYEFGKSAVATFKRLLSAERPDVQWVTEQWPAMGKIDAGATVQAIAVEKPDAIFNATFGPDLARFAREGNIRGLFKDAQVFSILTGQPEFLDPLKGEAPVGWIVTGYPWYAIKTPEHQKFLDAYQNRFKVYPRAGSVSGYTTVYSIAAAIRKAGSVDTDKIIEAFKGLKVMSPFGPIVFRAIDHQSTMGMYVGKIALKDGRGIMVDWRYVNGADCLPSDEEVRKMRPKD